MIFVLILFLLSGCMVGPNYHRPCLDIPNNWETSLSPTVSDVNLVWWEQFGDPTLNELIVIALNYNQDLRLATCRVDEFLGLYQITRADLFPRVDGESLYGRERVSESLTPTGPGIKNPDNVYGILVSGRWELDLWGKLRRATEASIAELLASEEARQTVIQTLVSAVATTYIDILRLEEQLKISYNTAETRRKTLELFEKRFAAGVISKIDLSQIESEYQAALAAIPEFQRLIEQSEHALSVLTGQNPGRIPRLGTIQALQTPAIPENLPSDLLYQRPDIGEVEQRLIAANARIGVARAAYFPTISLTGEYGSASRELSDLFTGKALSWNYFVPVSVPIFTAGKIAGEVNAAEAVYCQLLAEYRQQILVAFQETEDALVAIKRNKEQLDALEKQVESLETYASLAKYRYDEGYASYLEVLDAERSLFNAQLEYSETWGNYYLGMVSLYKALGGGWICKADHLTPDCCY